MIDPKPYTLVANWKMFFSYNQALEWCQQHKQDLIALTTKHSFIVCPSYDVVATLSKLFAESSVKIGAQNCSEYSHGAYTGQVSAQSLNELGARYCIIGHSEVRTALCETNDKLFHKMEQLVAHSLIPIFCIGETKEEHEQKITHKKIEQQLEPLLRLLRLSTKPLQCLIAYEPIWAIGTGIVADNDHISLALTHIKKLLEPYKNTHTFSLLYGGAVTGDTLGELIKIRELEGFLVGKAGTNFQVLKKIVSLLEVS
jgi:triosephosphate isomerase (TIM)